MKTFQCVRTDTYVVEVEAVSKEEAQEKLDEDDDDYLNTGEYAGSVFRELTEG